MVQLLPILLTAQPAFYTILAGVVLGLVRVRTHGSAPEVHCGCALEETMCGKTTRGAPIFKVQGHPRVARVMDLVGAMEDGGFWPGGTG